MYSEVSVSVLPIFKKELAEAVSLVLKAGASAEGGEAFALDMGEPVKIDDEKRGCKKLSFFYNLF